MPKIEKEEMLCKGRVHIFEHCCLTNINKGRRLPQAFPVSELGKGHAEKLVSAGKAFDLVIAVVSCDAVAKFADRK